MVYNIAKVIILVLLFVVLCFENVELTVKCGVPQIAITKTILHGYDTIPGAWPWHAAVYHRKRLGDGDYACGGTLISELFVLTAAHCVVAGNGYLQSKNNIFIRLGVYDLGEIIPHSVQQHSIQKIHKHPSYTNDAVQHDIAILELRTEVEFNKYVLPACLGLMQNLTGRFGTVVGWGRTQTEDFSATLKGASLPVIDVLTCLENDREVFGNTLGHGILCAGHTNGTGTCNGDSGGGLFFQYNNAWYLGGIVSYTGLLSRQNNFCNPKSYGGFTDMQVYLPWITLITGLEFAVCNKYRTFNMAAYVGPNSLGVVPDMSTCDSTTKLTVGELVVAKAGEFPHMAAIGWRNCSPTFYCGGSLISDQYVLTAAHCRWNRQYQRPSFVRLGDKNLIGQNNGEKMIDVDIDQFIRHPEFKHKRGLYDDIALIRLKTAVAFSKFIRPACLYDLFEPPSKQAIAFGYDIHGDDFAIPDVISKMSLNIYDNLLCNKTLSHDRRFNKGILPTQLCVGNHEGRRDGCVNIASLQVTTKEQNHCASYIIGISSFGQYACNTSTPDVYTRVASYLDWIESIVWK